jgi:hypothetical protein
MTAIAKLHDRFTEADIDSEIVIMRLDNGDFFSLSGTGATVWRLIDGTRDRAALAAAAAEAYAADTQRIGADVDQFLEELREQGLLAAG